MLTPLAVDRSRPFPAACKQKLEYCRPCLRSKERHRRAGFAVVQVPSILPRFLELPCAGGTVSSLLLEDVIIRKLDELFELHEIEAACPFRVTRNSDLDIDEEAEDFLSEVKKSIKQRKRGRPVRLGIAQQVRARTSRRFLIGNAGDQEHGNL